MNFNPVGDRVLVEPLKEEAVSTSGIVLAEKKEKPDVGVIIIGTKNCPAGNKILFSKFGFDELTLEGKVYYVVSENCILGYFTD